MTSITINDAGDRQYTPEALDRASMLIEDVLRGRAPLRIDGIGAHTGKPVSMIRAAVARCVAAGELAITPAGHVALVRCKPATAPGIPIKTRRPRKATK